MCYTLFPPLSIFEFEMSWDFSHGMTYGNQTGYFFNSKTVQMNHKPQYPGNYERIQEYEITDKWMVEISIYPIKLCKG